MSTQTMKSVALSQFDLLMSYRDRIEAGENVNPDHLAELAAGVASTVRVLQSERAVEKQRAGYTTLTGITEKVA